MSDRASAPNILLIQADQLRADVLPCYGGRQVYAPEIARLASESVAFDRAYCVTPVCTPARASLQTGLYPHRHGMQNNIYYPGCLVHELVDSPRLLSRQLASAGYWTGFTGKWHLGFGAKKPDNFEWRRHLAQCDLPPNWLTNGTLPSDVGYVGDDFPGHGGGGHDYPQYREYLNANGLKFEHQIASNGAAKYGRLDGPIEATVDYFLAERALGHLHEAHESGRPFFYSLNFWGPHEPCFVPQSYLDRYDPDLIKPWASFAENPSGKPSIHALKRPPGMVWSDFAIALQHYYAHITVIDEQIGRILQWLRLSGLYENTVVIFTADHGESLGIHGGLTDKAIFMYEETCRIPLVIKSAGSPGASKPALKHCLAFSNTTDIYSTILDCAGVIPATFGCDGRSLMPLVRGESPSGWPDHVVTMATGLGHVSFSQRMIRHGNWKYIFNCGDMDELYDVSSDPDELRNLSGTSGLDRVQDELRKVLRDWMVLHRDPLLEAFGRMRPVLSG